MQSLYGVLVPPHTQQTHAWQQTSGLPLPSAGAMAPPPDGTFATRDELLNYLKTWAASQGYAVVIGRSRVNRLWIRCDRGGEYRDKHAQDPSARQRRRKESRLTGCEFSIKASMRKDGLWRSRCECGEHNHGPSEDLREHPSLRRMTDEQLAKVHELTEAGKSPAEIMEILGSMWPDIKVIRRDIYNARSNFKTMIDRSSVNSSTVPSVCDPVSVNADTSSSTSLDPSGRIAPTRSCRNDDRVVTKKRKVTGPPSTGSEDEATQSDNGAASDGRSAQFSSLPTATASPLQEHIARPSSWSRTFMRSSSTHFSISPLGEFTGTAMSHLSNRRIDSSATSRMSGNAGSSTRKYGSHTYSSVLPRPERRQKTAVNSHPGFRVNLPASPQASPGMSRQNSSYTLTPGQHTTAQAQSVIFPARKAPQSGLSAVQQSNNETVVTPSSTSTLMQAPVLSRALQQQAQTPKQKQSVAIIMQRMQCIEGELEAQKSMLIKILSILQNLATSDPKQQQPWWSTK